MFAIVGLGMGILYSVGGFFVDLFTIGLNYGTVLAFGALVGMPLIFGVMGLVVGLVTALLYNMLAPWLQWLSIEFGKQTK